MGVSEVLCCMCQPSCGPSDCTHSLGVTNKDLYRKMVCEREGGVEGRASENNFPPLAQILMGRTNKNKAYTFYCDYFLQCVVGRRRWKKGVSKDEVWKIATVTDEAFGMLLLENSWEKWVDMARRQSGTSEVDSEYTNSGVGKNSRKFQGWDDQGLTRFNELRNQVQAERMDQSLVEFDDGFLDLQISRRTDKKGKNRNAKETAIDVKKKVMCYNDLGNTPQVEKAMEEPAERERLEKKRLLAKKKRETDVMHTGLGIAAINSEDDERDGGKDNSEDKGYDKYGDDQREKGREYQQGDESVKGDDEEDSTSSTKRRKKNRMGLYQTDDISEDEGRESDEEEDSCDNVGQTKTRKKSKKRENREEDDDYDEDEEPIQHEDKGGNGKSSSSEGGEDEDDDEYGHIGFGPPEDC